ncbi:hypothetical protein H9L39_09386 [Fusarium oxysporum f. sp. albedinis]|nr:hypothetical protein H9L39_09386 [Fusarium oxysporum f. sp. albedinis]
MISSWARDELIETEGAISLPTHQRAIQAGVGKSKLSRAPAKFCYTHVLDGLSVFAQGPGTPTPDR